MDQLSTSYRTPGTGPQGHLSFERLLTEVSASFVNIPSDQVDAAICEAMRRIVDALGLDRSAVFQLQGPDNDLMMTHQSVLVPFKWPTVVWTGRDYPWSFRKLSNGEIAAFASLEEIADAGEREAARANGTKSRIALPLTIGGQFAGFIGFSSVRTERQWTEDIVGRLQLVASVFAGALARQRADAALRSSEARFRTLADNSSSMVWMAGLDNRASWFSRRWLEFVGHPMEHELGDGWIQGVHPADVGPLMSVSIDAKSRREPFTAEFRLRRHDGAWRWVFTHGVPNFDSDGVFQGYLGTSIDITERKLAEDAIRDLTGRLMTAQESERTRIARELHDDISQQIAGVAICLSGLKRKSDARENMVLQEEFASLQHQIACVTDSIRHLCHDLHPTVLDHGGLNPALRGHCADFARQHHIPVHFEAEGDLRVDHAPALCLFRVAQEALRNVATHADATSVHVTLREVNGDIVLTVTDDGRGFDEGATRASSSRLGLRSIDERVRLAHGRCVIESAPGLGTTVSVVLPMAGSTSEEWAAR
jgi:PAS domain S-box-containing protein